MVGNAVILIIIAVAVLGVVVVRSDRWKALPSATRFLAFIAVVAVAGLGWFGFNGLGPWPGVGNSGPEYCYDTGYHFLVRTGRDWDRFFVQIPNFTVSSVSPGLQHPAVTQLTSHLVKTEGRSGKASRTF